MLVFKYGLSPDYVLDEIQMYEIRALLKYGYYKNQDIWEVGRLIAYLVAQTHSKKKLKLQDICELPWEKEDETKKANPNIPTREEFEAAKKRMEMWKDKIFNNS